MNRRSNNFIPSSLLLTTLCLAVVWVAVLPCCSEMSEIFKAMSSLSRKLVSRYSEPGARFNVKVEDGVLQVSFVNSSFNSLDHMGRKRKAREIAVFAKENYPLVDRIREIRVSFVIHEKKLLVVDYTMTLDTFSFGIRELAKESLRDSVDLLVPRLSLHLARASGGPTLEFVSITNKGG